MQPGRRERETTPEPGSWVFPFDLPQDGGEEEANYIKDKALPFLEHLWTELKEKFEEFQQGKH